MNEKNEKFIIDLSTTGADSSCGKAANVAFEEIINNPHGLSNLDNWLKATSFSKRNYTWAENTFDQLNQLLFNRYRELALQVMRDPTLRKEESLSISVYRHIRELKEKAEQYFVRRIKRDLTGIDVSVAITGLSRCLETRDNHLYLKAALENLRIEYEKYHERRVDTMKLEISEKSAEVIPAPDDQKGYSPDYLPRKFTRKEVIFLLQKLIPQFKEADNTRKAEFIYKLTGLSIKNTADEFTHFNEIDQYGLLAEWEEKFKKSGRGRKKKINRGVEN
jgi:hypothetical protein